MINQLRLFRTYISVKKKSFKTFAEMAKYILTSTCGRAFEHLHYFVSIIFVMPFTTADCERSFCDESDPNRHSEQTWRHFKRFNVVIRHDFGRNHQDRHQKISRESCSILDIRQNRQDSHERSVRYVHCLNKESKV